jgi:hypothetical protein
MHSVNDASLPAGTSATGTSLDDDSSQAKMAEDVSPHNSSNDKSCNERTATHEKQLESIDEHDLQSVIRSMSEVTKLSNEWFRLKKMEICFRNELKVDLGGENGKPTNQVAKDVHQSNVQVGLARPEQIYMLVLN